MALSREGIVETVGAHVLLDELEELEILFLSFSEIGSLEHTPRLRRLTLIDNGIRCISNLQPVALTLTSLCLCDQEITSIVGLGVCPNLRELLLHRNAIVSMDGLKGCARLRKLWLFQNRIRVIEGLHGLPELTEFWIQANGVRSLAGLEHNACLEVLAVGGCPIDDFRELRRLAPLTKLKALSLSDIHFGRCPIAGDSGYKHFVATQLPQIRQLDDVFLTTDAVAAAQTAQAQHEIAFNQQLAAIDDDYRREVLAIESAHRGKEGHAAVLEREMLAAMQELQGLVAEGRQGIARTVARQGAVMDRYVYEVHLFV